MNWKDYLLLILPVPVHYLYKGRDRTEKCTSRRRAVYPVNRIPHPLATELHGVYLRKSSVPELDQVFDSKNSEDSKEQFKYPGIEDEV